MQPLSQASNCPPAADRCAGVLLDTLPGIMRFVRRQMRGRRAKGLSVPQFRTLVQLRRCPAASLSSISESLGSSLPTTSRIVSGLVAKGLILRKTARDDRRQSLLQLTHRGQAVIDAAWSGTQTSVADRFSDLSEEQLVILAEALNMLSRTFPPPGEEASEAIVETSRPSGEAPDSIALARRPATHR